VRLHGAPSGRVANLLRRWVWRDAAAGLSAKGTSVVAVRSAVTAVDTADGYDAAQALLNMVPSRMTFVPQIERVHLNHAAAKINLLGLLSVGPRDLTTGAPLDASSLLSEGRPDREIITDPVAATKTFANRVVVGDKLSRPVRSALSEASEEVALSHLVDRRAQALLAADDLAEFLELRAQAVAATIRDHVNVKAEWGARDGRSVVDMIRSAA
jgi:hypothetical protein